jgi:hypothetical protein
VKLLENPEVKLEPGNEEGVPSGNTVKVLGKDFIPRVLVMKKRRVRAKGKEYVQYYINVPKDLAAVLEKEAGAETNEIPLLALVRVAEWYHLLDWSNVKGYLKESLPESIRKELEELGFLPRERRRELLLAKA